MSKNEEIVTKGNKKHAHLSRQEKKQQKIIMTAFIVVAILIVGSITFGLLNEYVLKYNRPVATVNGEKLMPDEFEKQVRFSRYQTMEQYLQYANLAQMFGSDPQMGGQFTDTLNQLEAQLLPDKAVDLGQSVLDQRTRQILLHQEAVKMGITISDAALEEALQNAFGYFPNGTPTPAPTEIKFVEPTLSAEQIAIITITPTPTEEPTAEPVEAVTEEVPTEPTPTSEPLPTATAYTEDSFVEQRFTYLDKLNKLGINFTEDDLRGLIYDQLVNEAVQAAVTADISKSEEHVWVRHILVKDLATAQVVIDSLKQGKDWAELAATLSIDTSNKDSGGDLGWFPDGQMVPEFWTAANALEIGEISEPVETQFGFHIIQLLGKEVRPLDSKIYDNKVSIAFNTWLTDVIDNADIVTSDNWMNFVPKEPVLSNETLAILTGQDINTPPQE